jgi:hypothetical protein
MIEKYQFGRIIVEGRAFESDIKIVDDRVVPNWWRMSGHSVEMEDIDDILNAKPEILVIGTGQPGRMESTDNLRAGLQKADIKLLEQPTSEAIQTFNRLKGEGKRVAAAFHLTC